MRKCVLITTGLGLLLCLVAPPTSAVREPNRSLEEPDYTVNSTADPGVGSCDTTECTLREAITAANGDSKVSNIAFNIPTSDSGYNLSTGVWTIQLTGALPALTEEGTGVMGSTQTGNRGDTNPYGPEIAVKGASTYDCFDLRSAYNTIEGLAINECRYGILILDSDAHNNNISGNYIGLDAQGTSAAGNAQFGIYIGNASDNTVGGGAANARNIISGNGQEGVWIYGDGADRNDISGNYIGTDSSGRVDVGNLSSGAYISGGAEDNQIGPDNIIAYNNAHGVSINGSATISNTVTQNSIHSNIWGGITLGGAANGGISAPSISSSSCVSISGTAPANSTVEIFTGPDGEGKTYLTNVSADGDGDWSIVGAFPLDAHVTATATDAGGNTSQFSGSVTPDTCHVAYVPIALKGY